MTVTKARSIFDTPFDMAVEARLDANGEKVPPPVGRRGGGAILSFWEITMSIDISRETEARLTDEARRLGVSVDALLKRFIDEHAAVTYPARARPGLAIWQLGGVGALHRRDIYNDVR